MEFERDWLARTELELELELRTRTAYVQTTPGRLAPTISDWNVFRDFDETRCKIDLENITEQTCVPG